MRPREGSGCPGRFPVGTDLASSSLAPGTGTRGDRRRHAVWAGDERAWPMRSAFKAQIAGASCGSEWCSAAGCGPSCRTTTRAHRTAGQKNGRRGMTTLPQEAGGDSAVARCASTSSVTSCTAPTMREGVPVSRPGKLGERAQPPDVAIGQHNPICHVRQLAVPPRCVELPRNAVPVGWMHP
jgi:hypothetical protein